MPTRLAGVAPGSYRLSFTTRGASGTSTKDVEVVLKGDEATVVAITFGTGKLSVFAPRGSSVFLFGKRWGRAPLRSVTVIEGTHEVMVVGPKVGTAREKVTISPGKTTTLHLR